MCGHAHIAGNFLLECCAVGRCRGRGPVTGEALPCLGLPDIIYLARRGTTAAARESPIAAAMGVPGPRVTGGAGMNASRSPSGGGSEGTEGVGDWSIRRVPDAPPGSGSKKAHFQRRSWLNASFPKKVSNAHQPAPRSHAGLRPSHFRGCPDVIEARRPLRVGGRQMQLSWRPKH